MNRFMNNPLKSGGRSRLLRCLAAATLPIGMLATVGVAHASSDDEIVTSRDAYWPTSFFMDRRDSSDPLSKFANNNKQGADGSYWVWRYQNILRSQKKTCPAQNNGPCKIKYTFSSNVDNTMYATRIVFDANPLPGWHNIVRRHWMQVKLLDKSVYVNGRPTIGSPLNGRWYEITVPAGHSVFPSVIALDKWIPPGKGSLLGGYATNFPFDSEYYYTGKKVATWTGHVFKRHQAHFCVSKVSSLPDDNSQVTCNAPADIQNGVEP
jgi:hypothetical protein